MMDELLARVADNYHVLGTFVVRAESEFFYNFGQRAMDETRMRQIALILTQTLHALPTDDWRQLVIEGSHARLLLISYEEGLFGVLADHGLSIEDLESLMVEVPTPKAKPITHDAVAVIEEVASEWFGDLAPDILSVQYQEHGFNPEAPSQEQLLDLIRGLNTAATMVVGPRSAEQMIEKLKMRLKDLGVDFR
jgi:hypothetical protein